jgi:hypothetical protein
MAAGFTLRREACSSVTTVWPGRCWSGGAFRWEKCSCTGTNRGGVLGQATTTVVWMSTSRQGGVEMSTRALSVMAMALKEQTSRERKTQIDRIGRSNTCFRIDFCSSNMTESYGGEEEAGADVIVVHGVPPVVSKSRDIESQTRS